MTHVFVPMTHGLGIVKVTTTHHWNNLIGQSRISFSEVISPSIITSTFCWYIIWREWKLASLIPMQIPDEGTGDSPGQSVLHSSCQPKLKWLMNYKNLKCLLFPFHFITLPYLGLNVKIKGHMNVNHTLAGTRIYSYRCPEKQLCY